ncbi:hypothetical protein OGM63_16435 [Plectonema radiosum NIES-515]|uniref:Uncharacterized protein n=1 Tax=Plectonema radiosum NIES-515 TaxID=2986073 RepID=A0ABT3B1G3_9CYAN|nr:hypothetical protein [Plectonema radiosum]MCV3215080.1 hypothetical protein [Plectonema radiosum NIES-515]
MKSATPKKPWQLAVYIVSLYILWSTRLQVYAITIAPGYYSSGLQE